MMRPGAFVALVGLLAGVLLPLAALAAPEDDTILISRASGADGAGAGAASTSPAVSKDGRFVVFSSEARNLSEADSDTTRDIFVRDLRDNRTELASIAAGRGARGGDGNSAEPSISADGRFVAFQSKARGLAGVQDDEIGVDVYVRDRRLRTTALASRATGSEGEPADFDSTSPALSANGRVVAFESIAENLSAADDARYRNIFVRDLRSGATRLVDRASGSPGKAANGSAADPSISADGDRVAFESDADNLSRDDRDKVRNIYVRDLGSDRTLLVSRADGEKGRAADGASSSAAISADGRFVAFVSEANSLSEQDDDSVRNVYVRDLENDRTLLANRANSKNGAGGNLSSGAPSISDDGRLVAFESLANDLSDRDDDAGTDRNVFVRDLIQGKTLWISRAKGTQSRKGDSHGAAIAGGGSLVAFSSNATNLSDDDVDPAPDVFALPLELPRGD